MRLNDQKRQSKEVRDQTIRSESKELQAWGKGEEPLGGPLGQLPGLTMKGINSFLDFSWPPKSWILALGVLVIYSQYFQQ